jgi:hypothetical protein
MKAVPRLLAAATLVLAVTAAYAADAPQAQSPPMKAPGMPGQGKGMEHGRMGGGMMSSMMQNHHETLAILKDALALQVRALNASGDEKKGIADELTALQGRLDVLMAHEHQMPGRMMQPPAGTPPAKPSAPPAQHQH